MLKTKMPAGLERLLRRDRHARAYFDALPSYARELVGLDATPICSERDLRARTDRLIDSLHH